MKAVFSFLVKIVGLVTIVCLVLGGIGLFLAGHWLQVEDEIVRADGIVILGGSYFRPQFAAELYGKGYAPRVYVSKTVQRKYDEVLKSVDIVLPPQEEIYRLLLMKRGVPENAIVFFGELLISTAHEAAALKNLLGDEPKTLILVTSPHHLRRAKLIFEDTFPTCTILATKTPYEEFPRKWWTTRESAIKVLSEISKIGFYVLGGRFNSNDGGRRPGPQITQIDADL